MMTAARLAALAVLCWSPFALIAVRASPHRLPNFHALAVAAGTDKVSNEHQYQHMYDRHLPRFRHMPVHFLEIGLGCDVYTGPGRSMEVWYAYFIHHNATIDFMERNGTCAEKFKHLSTRGQLLVGDQGNEAHLQRLVDRSQQISGYDIIVDDGGHTMDQQLLSFKKLWPVIKPGGIYVIEDLRTSYRPKFGGGPVGAAGTTIAWIKSVIDSLNCKKQGTQQPAECVLGLLCNMLNMDCFEEACVFTKAFD